MAQYWQKLRSAVMNEEEPEPEETTLLQQLTTSLDEATTLNRTDRLIGFAVCMAIALLFTLLSGLCFFPFFNPVKFAVMYTISNVFSISSTMFLMGPCAQLKRMFDSNRWAATTLYLLALVGTLVTAFLTKNGLLVLICLVLQIGAYVWYCLSYIPFARTLVSKVSTWFFGS